MKASWTSRTPLLALVIGLLLAAPLTAQQAESEAATIAELKQQQEALQGELTTIKSELQAIRGELKVVLRELRALRASQAQAKKPQRKADTTVYDIEIGDSPFRGPKDAKVTIVEYSSFACGWCTKEVPTLKSVLEKYPNDVRWVFKHFPLWDRAKPAHAAAALAYRQQGNEGFWKMHDLVFSDRKKLDKDSLRGYAEQLGLDLAEFDAVMADDAKINELSSVDTAAARTKYGVRGTPSVFVNGLKLSPRGMDNYQKRIDTLLKGKPAAALKVE